MESTHSFPWSFYIEKGSLLGRLQTSCFSHGLFHVVSLLNIEGELKSLTALLSI